MGVLYLIKQDVAGWLFVIRDIMECVSNCSSGPLKLCTRERSFYCECLLYLIKMSALNSLTNFMERISL